MPFISFSCLNDVARTSNTMLNRKGKCGHPFLVPNSRGKSFKLFTIEYNVNCDFVMNGLYYDEVCSLYNNFVESFYHNGCWILSNAFSVSMEMVMGFLLFVLLMWHIILTDLQIVNYPYISGIHPIWSWYMIIFIDGWIWFANILLRTCMSMCIRDTGF